MLLEERELSQDMEPIGFNLVINTNTSIETQQVTQDMVLTNSRFDVQTIPDTGRNEIRAH